MKPQGLPSRRVVIHVRQIRPEEVEWTLHLIKDTATAIEEITSLMHGVYGRLHAIEQMVSKLKPQD